MERPTNLNLRQTIEGMPLASDPHGARFVAPTRQNQRHGLLAQYQT
jgi:hypothetical protein